MKASEAFCKILDEQDIKYETRQLDEGRDYVGIGISGKSYTGIKVNFFFDDEESNSVSVKCFEICKFSKEKNLVMLQTVNALNSKFRWVAFHVTAEGVVAAETDVKFTAETVGELVAHALYRMASIMETAYPILMKALFS